MSKFIYVTENRVRLVSDTRPDTAIGTQYIEVQNDSVAENWYYDTETSTLSQYKPYTIDEVRLMRDQLLSVCDWMVLEDSPYQAADQSANLAAIKTYRQSLRDFPDENVSYDENNINWPTLTLS
jgi:hypothetical protein